MTQDQGITGIVLAGGAATRFGSDKLAASFGGRTLLRRAVDALEAACDEVIVVAAPGTEPDPGPRVRPLRVLHDTAPFPGPRAALLAGIEAAAHPVAVVAGADMPWLRPAFLGALVERLARDDRAAVAPILYGILQPLPCALRVGAVRDAAPQPDGSLLALLERVGVAPLPELEWREVDPAGESLQDVDLPGDLAGPLELPVRGWMATWSGQRGGSPPGGHDPR